MRLRPLRIGFVLLANPDRKGATMTAPATTAATIVDTDLAAATGPPIPLGPGARARIEAAIDYRGSSD